MREPSKLVVLGGTGVGKSHETMKFCEEVYCNPKNPNARNVLILDTNNEHTHIPAIRPEDIAKFNVQKKKQIRRLVPIDYNTGRPLGADDIYQLMVDVIQKHNLFNAMFWIEDMNKFTSGANVKAINNVLTTNRHSGLDLVFQLQTFGALPPKLWGNLNYIRIHKTNDSPKLKKVKENLANPEIVNIAWWILREVIRDDQSNEEPRGFVYVDMNRNKISGKFTYAQFKEGCSSFLMTTPEGKSRVKEVVDLKKLKGEHKIADAIKLIIPKLANEYLTKKSK